MFREHPQSYSIFGTGLVLSGILGLGACGKLPGFSVNEKADLFSQIYARNDKIDILFIVDNSGSMDEEQSNLANSFANFISHFASKNLKFQIGVTPTDTRTDTSWWNGTATYGAGCNTAGTKPYAAFANNGYGSLIAFTGNTRILTPSTTSYVTQFQQNANLGICGSGSEAGLLAATQALSTSKLGGWNSGFVREDAFLAVIVLSDEDESIGNGDATYIKTNTAAKNTRITNFKNTLLNLKGGDASRVRFDAIVAPSIAACPTLGGGASAVGSVYMEVAAQLGGTTSNICTDFSTDLDNLGTDLVVLATKFKLLQPPNGDIEVIVNGEIVPEGSMDGWTFNATTLEVEFHGNAIPPENAQISVNYKPARPA